MLEVGRTNMGEVPQPADQEGLRAVNNPSLGNYRPQVLLAAHTGQPWGGIATHYDDLLHSLYSNITCVTFVETEDTPRAFGESGAVTAKNLQGALIHEYRFARELIRGHHSVVHIATAMGGSFAKHSLMALLACALGKRVVLSPHCSMSKLLPEGKSFWRSYVLYVLRKCDGILALSREWLRLSDLAPGAEVKYLPNAINLEPYASLRRPKANPGDPVQLLYLGHIGEEKGTLDIVEAVRRIASSTAHPFRVHLVGSEGVRIGDDVRVNAAISRYGVEDLIRLHPPEFGSKKINRLQNADIYLLPSHHEGMPISIIEAMAAGLPVVATRVGGIPDLIETNESGILVPPRDPESLSEAIRSLVDSPETRLQMGLVGRSKALQNHDITHYARELCSFYYQIEQR